MEKKEEVKKEKEEKIINDTGYVSFNKEKSLLIIKKNKKDKDILKIWDLNIKEILETGNVSVDIERGAKLFNDVISKEEMILRCLVRKKSIIDGVHYNLSYGASGQPELYLLHKFYLPIGEEYEYIKTEITDLIIEVENIISKFNIEKKKK